MHVPITLNAFAILLATIAFSTTTAGHAAESAPLRVLSGAKEMPPQARAEEEALKRAEKIGRPPGKTKAEDLLKKIHARKGGRERIEHAEKARRPGGSQKKVSAINQQPHVVDDILSFIVPQALAADAGSVTLTPTADGTYGARRSLYSSSPYAYATFYGALINHYYPRNSYVRLSTSIDKSLGKVATVPHVKLIVRVAADGWYTLNMNAYITGSSNVSVIHSVGGNNITLESLPRESGWNDYPTLQYLSAGYHYVSWVMPQGGYVARLSMDPYKVSSFTISSGG